MIETRILFAASLFLAVAAFGCGGPAVQQTDVKPMGETTNAEQDKIREALIKAGIKQPPAAVLEMDKDTWVVVITPEGTKEDGTPPPGKPIPLRVLVDKNTFKVTKQGDPNEKKGPREL